MKLSKRQIQRLIKKSLPHLSCQSRLLPNAINMDPFDEDQSIKALIIGPYPYDQAVGNLAAPMVYKYFSRHPDTAADIGWAPSTRREEKWERKIGLPPVGSNTHKQYIEFDIVGFSINHLPQIATAVQLLQRSSINPVRADREPGLPLVLAGSNSYGNVAATGEMADAVWVGEMEDENGKGVHKFLDDFKELKDEYDLDTEEGWLEFCHQLAVRNPYVYFPILYEPVYEGTSVLGWKLKFEDVPFPVVRHWVEDLDSAPFVCDIPVSFAEPEGMGCQPAGELVFTDRGLVPIENVRLGDQTGGGEVTKTMTRKAESLVRVNISALPSVYFTPEHPVLVRAEKAGGSRFVKAENLEPGSFVKAENLEPGSFVEIPINDNAIVPDPIEVAIEKESQYDSGTAIELPFDEDMMVILAEYLADGYPESIEYRYRRVESGFGVRKQEHLKKYTEILQRHGISYSTRVQMKEGSSPVTSVRVYCSDLGDWLVDQFGNGAMGKRLPAWFYDLPVDLLKAFLDYYPDGTYTHPPRIWRSCNKALMMGIALVALKCGYMGTCHSKPAGYGSKNLLWVWTHSPNPRASKRIGDRVISRVSTVKEMPPRSVLVHNISTTSRVYDAPFTVHNSGETEASRSCTGTCLFCAATWRSRPCRIRSLDTLIEGFKESVKTTGASDISPVTLEFGTHPHRREVLYRLAQEVSDNVGVPSLRVDNYADDPIFSQILVAANQAQVTLAIEGVSQRLRTGISKGIDQKTILKAYTNAIRAGISRIKLYMIADLPGETPKDIREIIGLAQEMSIIRTHLGKDKVAVRFSFTPLCIEPHTPLQWQPTSEERKALGLAIKSVMEAGIKLHIGKKASRGQRMFHQSIELADRRLAQDILREIARSEESFYSIMSEELMDRIDFKIAEYGGNIHDTFGAYKQADEVFPWDITNLGVDKWYMRMVYENMIAFLASGRDNDVEEHIGYLRTAIKCDLKCSGCGACSPQTQKIIKGWRDVDESDIDLRALNIKDETTATQMLRLKVKKTIENRWIPPAYIRTDTRRALRQIGIAFDKAKIKTSSDRLMDRPFIAGTEYIDIPIRERIVTPADAQAVIDGLNNELSSVSILDHKIFPIAAVEDLLLNGYIHWYEITTGLLLPEARGRLSDVMSRADEIEIPVRRTSAMGLIIKLVPLKEAIFDHWMNQRGTNLTLSMLVQEKISPYDVLAKILKVPYGYVFENVAIRRDILTEMPSKQTNYFQPRCKETGLSIPLNPIGKPVSKEYTPKMRDKVGDGVLIE